MTTQGVAPELPSILLVLVFTIISNPPARPTVRPSVRLPARPPMSVRPPQPLRLPTPLVNPFTYEQYLRRFDTPILATLESERVWPIPALIRY